MISPDLIQILCCPETHQPVRPAEANLITRLNSEIARGALSTRSGQRILERIEDGLIRADGQLLYPIRRGIPVMLMDEAIMLQAKD